MGALACLLACVGGFMWMYVFASAPVRDHDLGVLVRLLEYVRAFLSAGLLFISAPSSSLSSMQSSAHANVCAC